MCFLLLAVVAAPGGPRQASAAQTGDTTGAGATWGIVPSSANGPTGRVAFEYTLDPGAVRSDYVGVSNYTDGPLELRVYASDAFTASDGGFGLRSATDEHRDVGAWVRFGLDTVTVPPRSRVDMPFRLSVPPDATPGDHVGGIVASLATRDASRGVTVEHRVGARVYLRVTGDLAPALQISELRLHHDSSWNPFAGSTVTVSYTVRNTGNVRLSGQPSVTVDGPFGLARATERVPELPDLLPGAAYRTATVVSGVLPLGRLTARVEVDPRASTGESIQPEPAAARAQARLWAWPWSQFVLLIALVLIVLAVRWAWRRSVTRAARSRAPVKVHLS